MFLSPYLTPETLVGDKMATTLRELHDALPGLIITLDEIARSSDRAYGIMELDEASIELLIKHGFLRRARKTGLPLAKEGFYRLLNAAHLVVDAARPMPEPAHISAYLDPSRNVA